jgi:hypothetical protein
MMINGRANFVDPLSHCLYSLEETVDTYQDPEKIDPLIELLNDPQDVHRKK